MKPEYKIRKSIRNWLLFFISTLIVSGVTAFALETELAWLNQLLRNSHGPVSFWLDKVYTALRETNQQFPFLAYGYDWLGFAHLVIAVAFFGVLIPLSYCYHEIEELEDMIQKNIAWNKIYQSP